jgi:hypothetical protein
MSSTRMSGKPSNIEIRYVRLPAFRSFHVDGVFGGFTPRGQLFMNFYVEHTPLPERMVYRWNNDGPPVEDREAREQVAGTERMVECGIILDVSTALTLRDWLTSALEQAGVNAAPDPEHSGARPANDERSTGE